MPSFLPAIERHLRSLIAAAEGQNSPTPCRMWPSVVDVRTGSPLGSDHVPRRVYRLIGAPGGSTMYWDQPLVVAAHALSKQLGNAYFAQAAEAYQASFLEHCVAPDGMFLWGNHHYFDLAERRVVSFTGGYHELRPITPAWDGFWRQAPQQAETYLRTMVRRHLYDPESGGFNRHDDARREHAFLEAGGILVESLAWLHARTGDSSLRETALRIARYSFRHRGERTGLIRNEPDKGRWDSKVCTSEVGLWARSLLRAAEYMPCDELVHMAGEGVRAYLRFAYDEASQQYFGQVSVEDGSPDESAETGYWPRKYANPWNTDQWPTHDYPMALAEASLTLHATTGEQVFLDGVHRLARIAVEGSPAHTGQGAYAENYGRCILLLLRAGLQLQEENLVGAATSLAEDAVATLYRNGMFQGYPDSNVYESVDGVGVLMLGLLWLETRTAPDFMGLG